jgi:hypothetical protein
MTKAAAKTAAPVEDQTPTTGDEPRVEQAPAEPPTDSTKVDPTVPSDAPEWSYVEPPSTLITRIQRGLGRNRYYSGPANGVWDERTRKAVQEATSARGGYSGSDDGVLDNQRNVHAVLAFARNEGGYAGALDDKLDAAAWSAFVVGLEKE